MTSWKKTFISAFIAQIFSIVGFSFVFPFLPFFIEDLGITDKGEQAFWAGVVMSATGVSLAFFAPIWGVLADKFGRKLMVVRAMAAGGIIVTLMSFVQSVEQLAFLRLLQGAATGTISASVALVASVTPERRSGLTLGMMQTAVFIGLAVGPLIGGVAADCFGYRMAFRIGAAIIFAGGLLVYFGTHEKPRPAPEERAEYHQTFMQIFMSSGFLAAVLSSLLSASALQL